MKYAPLLILIATALSVPSAIADITLVSDAVSQKTSFASSIGFLCARKTLFTSPSDATAMPSKTS
jgi:hypothetical protein